MKKGSIIHGTTRYDEEMLDNISKTGILTGQAVGVSEDGETYYCADFHRVSEDTTVIDYCNTFSYNDGRCPFGKTRADNSSSVAFVIEPSLENAELLSYDCYRDGTKESDITKSFINMMPIEDKEKASSILYGVPSSCFSSIVVGGKLLDNPDRINYLISKFPKCYIMSSFGDLIYCPSKGEVLFDEIIDLRRRNASLKREKRLLNRMINNYTVENSRLNENYNELWNAMFSNCNSTDIANVLISLGWQGDIDSKYVDDRRSNFRR